MSTIKALRTQKSFLQKQLLSKLKVRQNTYSQWENGTRTPPVDILPKLAEVLNCSIEELVYAIIETKNQREKHLQN